MSQLAMKWYFEKEGISQGPCPEAEILTLVKRQQIVAGTLIWHAGLEEWDTVEKLKPEWLKLAATLPVAEPPAKQTVPKTEGPLPSGETAPAGHLPNPKAGLEKSGAEADKGGLLSRMFGFGKKKK